VAATLTTLAFTGALNPTIVLVWRRSPGWCGRPTWDCAARSCRHHAAGSLTAAMGIARTTSDTARIFGALTGAGMFAAIGIGPSYTAITVFYLLSAI
jgi:hypothetical protein